MKRLFWIRLKKQVDESVDVFAEDVSWVSTKILDWKISGNSEIEFLLLRFALEVSSYGWKQREKFHIDIWWLIYIYDFPWFRSLKLMWVTSTSNFLTLLTFGVVCRSLEGKQSNTLSIAIETCTGWR